MADVPKLPNQPSEADIHSFLSKVDDIESVIKGLNSENEEKRNFYMSKADRMIEDIEKKKKEDPVDDDINDKDLPKTRTGFSRTKINKDAYKNETQGPPSGPVLNDSTDQRAFMAAIEADAKERSERKKEREQIANKLKEQGNAEFRQGNYQKALEFYDQAIDQIRDSSVLYTNRAQSRIKLGMYTEALKDCDLATRLWPSCLKAYVHQGHAYLGLKEYAKARDSYKQILSVDKRKESMVKDYLADVDRAEEASQHEAKAAQLFDEGNEMARNVVDILTSINKKDQFPLYYSGCFRLLASLLNSNDSLTLFRTHGGLQLPQDHHALGSYLSASLHSLSKEERDVISSALEMLTAACKNNETNQQQLMSLAQFPGQLLAILEFNFKGHGRLMKTGCLNLLYEISLSQAGRSSVVSKVDANKLITALFLLVAKTSTYSSKAAALLNNIALDKRLKALLRDKIEEVILPAFEDFLKSSNVSPAVVSLTCSTATNLAGDVVIRNKMAARSSLWDALSQLLMTFTQSNFNDPLEYVLGLLLNLSTDVAVSSLQHVNADISRTCFAIITSQDLSKVAVARALAVLGNFLPHCDKAQSYLCQENRQLILLELMQREDMTYYKSALKCITALTQRSQETRQLMAENKGTSALMKHLNSDDEVVIGNAALCLSHLCQIEKVCAKLTKTNIIQKLLVLARDGTKAKVQSNCAILVGKLVKGDTRHLERLRELNGVEILHGCMKHVT
ncbi:unnamed protein product [Lymnaea stagnalis]|uniref:Tetratricopeptide repeat protein 12 n=1 Tax=Lymnaea stagnalis TaxID=6523 RepID=A0AAV2HI85_LYMST